MAPVGEGGLGLRRHLTVTCVLNHAAATTNWDAGGIEAPNRQTDALQREPPALPLFAMLQLTAKGIVYDKKLTHPTQSIWNCNPKNVVQLTAAQQAQTQRPLSKGSAVGRAVSQLTSEALGDDDDGVRRPGDLAIW